MSKFATYLHPAAGIHPKPLTPSYGSTVKRAPQQRPVVIPQTLSEITGPLFGPESVKTNEHDLTKQEIGRAHV